MGRIRTMYASEMLDDIFIYFMRTILHLEESGIEKLPLKQNFTEPVHTYLNLAMDFIIEGEMPETSELILKSEYDNILKNCDCNTALLLCLNMIRELSCHIHYDADMCDYIFNIGNLWGNRVSEYAAVTFYPKLSKEMQQKHQLTELVDRMPAHMLRLDNY